jgi:hypothetical protein
MHNSARCKAIDRVCAGLIAVCSIAVSEYSFAACSDLAEIAPVVRATGGDRYLTEVVCQVMTQAEALKQLGRYEKIPDFLMIGRIRTNMPIAAKTLYLRAGHRYAFSGACDSDCGDLDIHILDASGTVVARDVARDDHPMLSFSPAGSGTFAVVPMLVNCRARQCAYAVLAYEK